MCAPENVAKRDVLQRRLAEIFAKRIVWRISAAENIAFRGESARARARSACALEIVSIKNRYSLYFTVRIYFRKNRYS